MLTETQIEKLNPLLADARYGNLLQNAMNTWQKDYISPASHFYGIKLFDKNNIENEHCSGKIWQLDCWPRGNGHCCLVGASMINSNHIDGLNLRNQIAHKYSIDITEVQYLEVGFDKGIHYSINITDMSKKAFKFGLKVRLALGF